MLFSLKRHLEWFSAKAEGFMPNITAWGPYFLLQQCACNETYDYLNAVGLYGR